MDSLELQHEIERKCLYQYYQLSINDAVTHTSDGELKELVDCVMTGSYVEGLKSLASKRILFNLEVPLDYTTTVTEYFDKIIDSYLEDSTAEKEATILLLGISFLQLFIQDNFTGPISKNYLNDLIPIIINTTKTIEEINRSVLEDFALDSEGLYNLVTSPLYLYLAKKILIDYNAKLSNCLTIHWWCARCAIIYQKILDERSPHIYEIILKSLHNVEKNEDLLSVSKFREIRALFHLESLYIHLYYYDVGRARSHLAFVTSILGMKMSTTGALGKRTKWQVKDIPQLLLKVEFDEKTIKTERDNSQDVLLPTDIPKDINLNDDVRLNRINFQNEDEDIVPDFKPIEQAVILAELVLKRRSQAQDIQLDEESKAYIGALLQYPRNWCIHLSSLLLRSQVESADTRAMERSMNQLEELVAAVNRDEPSRYERSKLMQVSLVLPQWELQQELARMFMRLGCTKTALQIFERLHLWEDVITCYNELQMRQRSAEVIRQQMEKGESPKLWCLLGDATDDIDCYNKAWELSKQKSYRAQRCLGNYYYVRKEYNTSIIHYQISVGLNALQFPVWQRLAYCALQMEQWELCAQAYRRCSVLEPDSFESWNNMSQAYLKLDQKHRAWKTLQEALRCSSDSWKLWDNFMLVSTSLGYMSYALHAYSRILSLKEKHIDTEILGRIVKAIVEKNKDPDGNEVTSLHKTCSQLLAKLTREVPTNPELWYLYGEITFNTPNAMQETVHTAMQYYRKSVAAATQKPGWEKDTQTVLVVIQRALKLLFIAEKATCDVNVKTAIADLSSIRMSVKSVIICAKKGQTNITTGELVLDVQESIASLEQELNILTERMEHMRDAVA